MSKYTPVLIPRSHPNDEYAILTRLHVRNGEIVSAGQLLAEIETTKAQTEIVSPADGPLQLLCEEGEQIMVGAELARISVDPTVTADPTSSTPRLTRKALKLLRQGQTDKNHRTPMLDSNSYLSWVSVKVSLSLVKQAMTTEAGQSWTPSVADFITFHASKLLPKFPQFCKGQNIHVGLVLWEESRGPNLVTLREAQNLELKDFCARSQELMALLLRGELTASEFTGATFSVSNMISANVHSFMPRIPLGHSAILGIASPDERGEFQLVLSFDHRLADGILAAKFLNALRAKIS